jgi:glycerate dehydrogenase
MPMKLVVLDGYATNPGDLSWEALSALADCTIHDRTPAELTMPRAAGAALLLTNKTVLGREEICALPDLRYIGVLATGYNVVDVDAARRAGVIVTNIPAYSTASVAQTVFAFILEFTQQVALHTASVRAGEWTRSIDFAYWKTPLIELAGKTLGLVGLGSIGQTVARIGQAFGMRVIAATRTPRQLAGIEEASLDDVFRQADFLSLHCPLTPDTRHLVNADRLALMKPTAFLVNTSRGGVVDAQALANALAAGRLAGAGVDVLDREPPPADDPLLAAPNCWVTPHLAWATREARSRLLDTAVGNVRAFLAGHPRNVVS